MVYFWNILNNVDTTETTEYLTETFTENNDSNDNMLLQRLKSVFLALDHRLHRNVFGVLKIKIGTNTGRSIAEMVV